MARRPTQILATALLLGSCGDPSGGKPGGGGSSTARPTAATASASVHLTGTASAGVTSASAVPSAAVSAEATNPSGGPGTPSAVPSASALGTAAAASSVALAASTATVAATSSAMASAASPSVSAPGSSALTSAASADASASGTALPAASTSSSPIHDYSPCPEDGTPCKLMPFGDSITDGYNGDTPGGYRVELFRLANQAGKNITFVGSGSNGPDSVSGVPFPHNHEGHSGWAIDPYSGREGVSSLLQASTSVMLTHAPHVVLLMIGTNDAIDNHVMQSAPTRLGALIDTIYTQLPNVLIVVAQLVPGRDNAGLGDDAQLSARIEAYNASIPPLVQQRADAGKHIVLVDMYTPFNPNKAALLEDQWHPNLNGYVLIGSQWFDALAPYL